MKSRLFTVALALLLTLTLIPADAQAQTRTWEVTVTNVTANQIISPPILATHNHIARVFRPGRAANANLAAMAEDADSAGLIAALEGNGNVLDVAVGGGPLMPGHSMTFTLTTDDAFQRLSAVGMLVTTNDAFFGLDSYFLHDARRNVTFSAPAWDAGSEYNSESCDHIPGPPCGNPFVRVTEEAEGFVHIHSGIHGDYDLPTQYSWGNGVVVINAIRQ